MITRWPSPWKFSLTYIYGLVAAIPNDIGILLLQLGRFATQPLKTRMYWVSWHLHSRTARCQIDLGFSAYLSTPGGGQDSSAKADRLAPPALRARLF